jgi:hypothetical protein
MQEADFGMYSLYFRRNFRVHVFILLIGVFVVFGFMGADSDFPPVSQMNFYFDNDNMKYIIMALITLGSLFLLFSDY